MLRLRTQAIVLIALVAPLPLLVLGFLSLSRGREIVLDQLIKSRYENAERAATEIEAEITRYTGTVRRLAQTLSPGTHLTPRQAERILKDHRLDVPALRHLDLVGADGHEIATSRPDGKTVDRAADEAVRQALAGVHYRSSVDAWDHDSVPEIIVAEPQRFAGEVTGAVVATVDLSEMWHAVDRIRPGDGGYVRLVDGEGRPIAVGVGYLKHLVFRGERDRSELTRAVAKEGKRDAIYAGGGGRTLVGVGVRVGGGLGWVLVLEQPMSEALRGYYRFKWAIVGVVLALLLFALLLGWLGARTVVRPIEALRIRAGQIARGLLDARVEVRSPEELSTLADAMNSMCEDLIRLQDDVRNRERIATLGRLAAGLAHDLKHPVHALRRSSRLVLAQPDDARVRQEFAQVVQREFRKLEGFLDDLKRVSRDEPMNAPRARLDVADLLRDFAREQRSVAPAGIEIVVGEAVGAGGGLLIAANRELIGRVLSNLASNAYEAMEGEGRLTLAASIANGAVEISMADTGCGIPAEQVAGLFVEFATTKKRGLGLGLAVSKKIVEDCGGTLAVHSQVGRGSVFVVRLPARAAVEGESLPAA